MGDVRADESMPTGVRLVGAADRARLRGVAPGVRYDHGLSRTQDSRRTPDRRADGLYSIHGIAARFGVRPGVVCYWVRRGWIAPVEGRGTGHTQWFALDEAAICRLEAAMMPHSLRRNATECLGLCRPRHRPKALQVTAFSTLQRTRRASGLHKSPVRILPLRGISLHAAEADVRIETCVIVEHMRAPCLELPQQVLVLRPLDPLAACAQLFDRPARLDLLG